MYIYIDILCASLFVCAALTTTTFDWGPQIISQPNWDTDSDNDQQNAQKLHDCADIDAPPPQTLLLHSFILTHPCFVHDDDYSGAAVPTDTRSSITTTSRITRSPCKTRNDRVTVPGRRTRTRLPWPVVRCKFGRRTKMMKISGALFVV